MKKTALLLFLISVCGSAQKQSLQMTLDKMAKADSGYFECHSSYWKIVAAKTDAIPLLIAKLDDTTPTTAKNKCKDGNLKVGDIAFLALAQIMRLPIAAITQMQFDVMEANGCQGYVFDYIDANRSQFKTQVNAYYLQNKSKLKFQKYNSKSLNRCQRKNKILGYYDI